jgi:membrane protease YdiL (CAAX protease family)
MPKRVWAVLEVTLAFGLVHVTYRSFKHFTMLGQWESAAGLNFSPGVTMIVFTLVVLALSNTRPVAFGLTLRGWRTLIPLGLVWSILILLAGGLALASATVRFDPMSPPDLPRALLASAGYLAFAALVMLPFPRATRSTSRALICLAVLAAVVSVPFGVAWHFDKPMGNVLLMTLWLFFGAGFGEELFFRGYIQARAGLATSSLLFGAIHVLNTVDYFEGRFDFAWYSGLVNCCAGLFFGVLRKKTGSVLAGSIVHGTTDVLGSVPRLMA